MLLALQIIHTLIFVFNEALVVYLVWCAATGRGGRWMWSAIAVLLATLASIIASGWRCPLQILARKIAGVDHGVQDMLTPIWFNDLVVPVTTPIALAAMIVIVVRRLHRRLAHTDG